MKTILLSALQAVEVKNILRTPVITTLLADPEVRVVCACRFAERIPYYEKEIPHERIRYVATPNLRAGFFERWMSNLKFHLIRTKTTLLRRRMRRAEDGGRALYWIGVVLNWIIARPTARRLLRFADYHFISSDAALKKFFDEHRPDAVFLANLFDDAETALLREARRRSLPTIGFINTWDKLTARSSLRLLPDTLAVYNEIVKREAMEHADMPEERIRVCGIPQYDQYVIASPASREEFFSRIKLDPQKHLVLLAPMGSTFSDSDWAAIDLLHHIVEVEHHIPNAQLLVRFQPNDFIDTSELAKRPRLRYDFPGIRYGSERGGDWDMTEKDIAHLRDTLAHASVVVCYPSSLSVDAALADKPVINIGFEIVPPKRPSKNPLLWYRTEHYQKALAAGGIRLTESTDDLVHWMNAYLSDPALDRKGRKRLVREQCWKTDGKSGERIAEVIRGAVRIPNAD